jgi:hypothetical protein
MPDPACRHATTEGVINLGMPMHHSKGIAAQPLVNAKPVDRARDTKLKKLGLPSMAEDPKATKKQ